MNTTTDRTAECAIVRRQAEALVHLAQQLGVTLRIDVQPLQPPAMGHHEPVIEVWPAREQPEAQP